MEKTLRLSVGSRVAIKFTAGGTSRVFVVAPQGDKGSAVRNGSVWLVTPDREGQNPIAGEFLPISVAELSKLYGRGQLTSEVL